MTITPVNNSNALQNLTAVFIALLLSLFLLAFPGIGYLRIMEFKYKLFLILCGGYCALVVVIRSQLALTGIMPIGNIKLLIVDTPLPVKFLYLFLIFTIVSAILSGYPGTFTGAFRKEGVLTVAIYVLSCVFLSIYFQPRKWMLYLLGASTCLFCILAFVQLTGANPFGLFPKGYNYYGTTIYYPGEFLGTLGNTGQCAAFLSITAGVFSMSLVKLSSKEKYLIAVPLFITTTLLFKMNVDAGIVALAAGLLLMIPVAVADRESLADTAIAAAVVILAFFVSRAMVFSDGHFAVLPSRLALSAAALPVILAAVLIKRSGIIAKVPAVWYRIASTAIVIAVICVASIYLWSYKGESSGFIYEASEMLHGRWDDTFGTRRVYIWRNVLEGVRGNLLFGTGPDTLGFWDIDPFTRYNEHLGWVVTTSIDAAHNEYLHILACSGLIPLLCYLAALACLVSKWFRSPKNKLSAIAGAGVLFYCIQALFGISMSITAPFLWAGLAVLINSQRRCPSYDKIKKTDSTKHRTADDDSGDAVPGSGGAGRQ